MTVGLVIAGLALLVVLAVMLWLRRRAATGVTGLPASLPRVYTTHAKERMTQRQISEGQVEEVLSAPDRITRDERENSMRFEKEYRDVLVKVWVTADPWPPTEQVVVKTTAAQHFVSFRIPRASVGRLIGRGGSTIKTVQARTNARISVSNSNGIVRVQADDRGSVEQAVRMIDAIVRTG